ncbi:MAG: hypothetical protein LQ340_003902 [Diploschistes diacapsis]|nr:MAG: hypothetical protein LQ340_003902 [Diploschistes diacapsis]
MAEGSWPQDVIQGRKANKRERLTQVHSDDSVDTRHTRDRSPDLTRARADPKTLWLDGVRASQYRSLVDLEHYQGTQGTQHTSETTGPESLKDYKRERGRLQNQIASLKRLEWERYERPGGNERYFQQQQRRLEQEVKVCEYELDGLEQEWRRRPKLQQAAEDKGRAVALWKEESKGKERALAEERDKELADFRTMLQRVLGTERNANTGHGHGGEWKRTNVQDTRNTSTKGQGERRLQIRERTSATPVTGPVRCINGQKIPSERMENARSRPSRDEVALARTIRPDKSMDSLVAAIRTDSKWMISYPGNPQRSASDPHRTGPGASHDKKEEWEPRTPVAGHQSWPYQSHNAEVR